MNLALQAEIAAVREREDVSAAKTRAADDALLQAQRQVRHEMSLRSYGGVQSVWVTNVCVGVRMLTVPLCRRMMLRANCSSCDPSM